MHQGCIRAGTRNPGLDLRSADLALISNCALNRKSKCCNECVSLFTRASNRIFSGCNKTSVVVDASTGKIVASITNGTRVDALGWDPSKKLIFIPNGGEGNVTVVHQDSPDKYTVVATVPTFAGAKTITVDPKTHNAYLFQPERGPAPTPAPGAPPPAAGAGGRGRGP